MTHAQRRPRRQTRRWAATAIAVAGLAAVPALAGPASSAAALDCTDLSAPFSMHVDPDTGASRLTTNDTDAAAAAAAGFTQDRGVLFGASISSVAGSVPVYELRNGGSGDYLYVSSQNERAAATARYGYTDLGVAFYASSGSLTCGERVYRYRDGGLHRFAVSQADRDALAADGWAAEGSMFWAGPAPQEPNEPGDTSFTFAVIPDTQMEVRNITDRLANRNQWLIDNQDDLNLEFVTHSGDVVNWDDTGQYQIADAAMQQLTDAGIPYSLSVGNHDTAAVCPGGDACPDADETITLRDSSMFNDYFEAAEYGAVAGAYQQGQVDNIYSTFNAAGRDWMILNLELWPRQEVIDWAKDVVASHPEHNVIVVTHSYLNGVGAIEQTNGGYGATSPQHLYDELISQYPNIKLVFSGHTGTSKRNVSPGADGNVYSYLQAFHDRRPTRCAW